MKWNILEKYDGTSSGQNLKSSCNYRLIYTKLEKIAII